MKNYLDDPVIKKAHNKAQQNIITEMLNIKRCIKLSIILKDYQDIVVDLILNHMQVDIETTVNNFITKDNELSEEAIDLIELFRLDYEDEYIAVNDKAANAAIDYLNDIVYNASIDL